MRCCFVSYMGINTSASKPTNDRMTEIISFLDGFDPIIALITVEAMITPPVIKGYCADAGSEASEMRRMKFAIALNMPCPEQ